MAKKKKTILVVVAHPDDETFGMAGTIKKHILDGDFVFAIAMTDGVGAREDSHSEQVLKRQKAAELASEYLGFKWDKFFSFDDNSMDRYPLLDVVKCVEESKKRIKPNIVYTHSGADLNVDHRVLSKAVLTAFRPQPEERCAEIRLFEVPSSTDYGNETITGRFSPNLFVDITDTWAEKELALNAYKSEIRAYPHSRSIEGIKNLAKQRGNQVGLLMSEALQVIRKIDS